MAPAWPGLPGIIPTCPGTAMNCGSAGCRMMARSPNRSVLPAAGLSRSTPLSGHPTAPCTLCPTPAAGGICGAGVTAGPSRSVTCRPTWPGCPGCSARRPTILNRRTGIVHGAMRRGQWDLSVVEPGTGAVDLIWLPYTDIWSLRAAPGRVVFAAGSPAEAPCIVQVDLATYDVRVLHRSSDRPSIRATSLGRRGDRVPHTRAAARPRLLLSPTNPTTSGRRTSARRSWSSATAGPTMSTWTTRAGTSSTGPAGDRRPGCEL
jgi:hypothetical protein